VARARRVDRFGRTDGTQRRPWHGESESNLSNSGTGQGQHFELDAGQVQPLVVADHTAHWYRLDRGKVVPVVLVDHIRATASEMLDRITE